MKKIKKIISSFLVMLMIFALAGCSGGTQESSSSSGSTASADDEFYVIWVNPLVGSAVFTQADEGITAASEEYGFKLKIIGPSTLDDTEMFESLQSAIVENPDLIVTTPYNFTAVESLYDQAAEKGIPIINISSDSDEAGRVSFIGTDNTKYGELAADYINEKMNGEAKVLVMMANLDTSNQLEQRNAFEAKCKAEYPGIEIVLTDEDNGDSSTALQKFQDNLKANPEIDTILCLESIGGVAAANAMNELGRDDVTILAIDDNEDTLQYIEDGKIWGTMAQNFYKMGYTAGEFAYDYLNGEEVESIVDSGTILITKDNIDTYEEEFYK